MGSLHILPDRIANLIAAGEVVQRPSSVVKELMENAVDAGAESISVLITDAGRTLIQVIDDGCGMSGQDAALCFERHATSKIEEADDLGRISTFGFRGEALPSIAAVGQVTLRTRRREDATGTCIHAEQSAVSPAETVSCPVGTNIEVRNIFYNLPARRKFLKSNAAEFAHITGEFLRVALTRTSIRFSLTHNGHEVYVLAPVQNVKQRISALAGRDLANRLLDISADTSILRISGFIGSPESARKNSANQYFFINGRFFRSPYLHKAVCRAYANLVTDGCTPPYFIFLETAADYVDVNIHPTKTEIKFEDESTVFQILHSVVREALGRSSFAPSIDFDAGALPEIPLQHPKDRTYVAPPRINFDPLFNPFKDSGFEREAPAKPLADYGRLLEDTFEDRPVICIQDKYVITTVKSGLLLIDVSRARFRILFEKYLSALEGSSPIIQKSLFPHRMELPAEIYSVMEENEGKLSQYGFDIRLLGGGTIVVNGIPDGYPDDGFLVEGFIDDLVELLREGDLGDDYRRGVALRLARSASSGKTSLNRTEAQALVDSLFACDDPRNSPSGGKCMTIISLDQFGDLLK